MGRKRKRVSYTRGVDRRTCLALLFGATLDAAPPPAYRSARRKLDIIESDHAPAGAVYSFTRAEIEAWADVEVPGIVPEGLRNPRVELGDGTATGRALIDFARLRHAKGAAKNWFLDKLLEGERPVTVTIDLKSANGMCTVRLLRLEVGSVAATGAVLDFLVRNFFLTLFPNAKIGEPFELEHRLERINIQPKAVYAKIKDR